jgi:hypothetical protein
VPTNLKENALKKVTNDVAVVSGMVGLADRMRAAMLDLILITLGSLLSGLRGQAALRAENVALRHQLTVLQRTHTKRPVLKPGDRCLWVWLSRLWSGWRSVLIIVVPETVIGWHRQGLSWYWTWKARHGQSGRPQVQTNPRFDSNHTSSDSRLDSRCGGCTSCRGGNFTRWKHQLCPGARMVETSLDDGSPCGA